MELLRKGRGCSAENRLNFEGNPESVSFLPRYIGSKCYLKNMSSLFHTSQRLNSLFSSQVDGAVALRCADRLNRDHRTLGALQPLLRGHRGRLPPGEDGDHGRRAGALPSGSASARSKLN